MIKEKILEIIRLTLFINPPQIEDIGVKRDAIFIYISPHCNLLNVRIYLGGWRENKDADKDYNIYLDRENSEEKLDNLIECLKNIQNGILQKFV